MVRKLILLLVGFGYLTLGFSQSIRLENLTNPSVVFSMSENRFTIKKLCDMSQPFNIISTEGEIEITDSLLIWKNIKNFVDSAYLIVNEIDTIAFMVERTSLPEPKLYPRRNCRNINNYLRKLSKIELNSNRYKVLDYEVLHLQNLNVQPLVSKNYGSSLDERLVAKIKHSWDDAKLVISKIRYLDVYNNVVEDTDEYFYFTGPYYLLNGGGKNVNLFEYLELSEFAVKDTTKYSNSSWVHYSVENEFIVIHSLTKKRAKYHWVNANLMEYVHFVNEKVAKSGFYGLVNRSYRKVAFDPETYEEIYVPAQELVKIGKWKIFDQDGKLVKIRTFDNGVFVKEFDVE